MKINKIAITILMTTLLIILGTKVQATTGTINSDAVKLRKEPESKTVLDLLDEGKEVEILEQEGTWYKVKAPTELGKVTGYISEEFLEVKETVENQETSDNQENDTNTEVQENVETAPTVLVTETNTSNNIEENGKYTLEQEISIKRLPLINSKQKAKISGNITILEIINDWSRVESDIESGWIRTTTLKNLLVKTEETTQEPEQTVEQQPTEVTPEESITEANDKTEQTEEVQESQETTINKVGYISAEGLKVRKGPSTDTEEITSLSKNDKVQIIGQSGKWYKIDLNGKIGYVSAKYISDTKLPETTSRSGSTLKNETSEIVTEKEEEKEPEETVKVEEKPATPVTPETSTSGTTGTAVVEYAKQYLGYKYVSGGATPAKGFDCSGFTSYVYKNFGISLNRTSSDQIKNGVAVDKNDLQLGDIVLFNNDANTRIGHVGIYVGNGNFIHASNPSDGVKITTLTSGYYAKRYVGARRVI